MSQTDIWCDVIVAGVYAWLDLNVSICPRQKSNTEEGEEQEGKVEFSLQETIQNLANIKASAKIKWVPRGVAENHHLDGRILVTRSSHQYMCFFTELYK